MNVLRTLFELRLYLSGLPENTSIGFVPTMGALHLGHKSLVCRSLNENNLCICSIFVNPKQFENKKDLKCYPNSISQDIILLEECGCQALFLPDINEIYPQNFKARVFEFGGLDEVMEGASRPGHFDGVANVVSRLFDLVEPSRAYFGQKDAQQLCIIQSLKKQAFPNIEIVPCDTLRESDGLAISSRNTRLSPSYRKAVHRIYARLLQVKKYANNMSISQVKEWVRQKYIYDPDLCLDYFEISHPESLEASAEWNCYREHLACVAVYAGEIRLIDNIRIRIN
jgi:pantoate--beta-alanine ligase